MRTVDRRSGTERDTGSAMRPTRRLRGTGSAITGVEAVVDSAAASQPSVSPDPPSLPPLSGESLSLNGSPRSGSSDPGRGDACRPQADGRPQADFPLHFELAARQGSCDKAELHVADVDRLNPGHHRITQDEA
jgi:hypothetical protein